MTTIFISGSRNITRLNKEIRDRLKNVLDQHYAIVVGDANGADKAIQKYLMDNNYQYVTVYCSGNVCRNNAGNWEVSKIQVDSKLKGRDFYAEKDKKMAAVADYGFVLWDGSSPGSFNNIMELLRNNKKALVYFSPEKSFCSVAKIDDVRLLLLKCSQKTQDELKKKIKLTNIALEIEGMPQRALGF